MNPLKWWRRLLSGELLKDFATEVGADLTANQITKTIGTKVLGQTVTEAFGEMRKFARFRNPSTAVNVDVQAQYSDLIGQLGQESEESADIATAFSNHVMVDEVLVQKQQDDVRVSIFEQTCLLREGDDKAKHAELKVAREATVKHQIKHIITKFTDTESRKKYMASIEWIKMNPDDYKMGQPPTWIREQLTMSEAEAIRVDECIAELDAENALLWEQLRAPSPAGPISQLASWAMRRPFRIR